MSARVLVVDDERQFLRALATNLRGAGYEVETAATAAEALSAAALHPPDAVVLDLLLPDGSGTDVCRELRTWSDAPIVVVSAVGDEDEKIAALDAGADDYVTKPFATGELLARLRAALRRAGPVGRAGARRRSDQGRPGKASRHRQRQARPPDAARVPHPARARPEPRQAPDAPRDPAGGLGPAYGDESNYLHVYVSQLRKKLEADPASPRLLLTEPGAGYRLVDQP